MVKGSKPFGPVLTNLFNGNYHFDVKDIEFNLNSKEIHPNSEIKGIISVSYPGRYDGVVINTTILDSNEHIIYKSYNGKKISQNVSRLFINKDVMTENKLNLRQLFHLNQQKNMR